MPDPRLERLAASVLCVGFEGTSAQTAPLSAIAELGAGGVILFARNTLDCIQTAELTAALTAAYARAGTPRPFVAVDQEGGRVARLRAGVRELPAMMAVGAAGDAALAERLGVQAANDLVRAGITVDFAPCLDLALQPKNTVIGTRSFGSDPAAVAALGGAFARGLVKGGVHATIKHFPGHGSTAIDSHLALPVIDESLSVLRERDLVPFERVLGGGGVMVMSAHIVVRALDPQAPATLSPRVLTGLLRDELGYDGVCFTDDLEMQAIATNFGVARAATLAIAAGADCALICHRLELAREAAREIAAAVESGALPEERLTRAAERVARLRGAALVAARTAGDPAAEVARRAVTVVRGEIALPPGANPTIVSFEGKTHEGAAGAVTTRGSLGRALRQSARKAETMRVALDPSPDEIEVLAEIVSASHPKRMIIMTRRAHLYAGQRAAVEMLLKQFPAAAVVSAAEPFDLACFPQARTAAAIYDDGELAVEGLADVMCGDGAAAGTLPVALALEAPI